MVRMRQDWDYWQRLRKDRRSNWAAGFAAVATMAATVSLVGLLVKGTHYEARSNPLYWGLMLPAAWWVNGLAGFKPCAVRWWKPALLLSVVVATVVLIVAAGRDEWVPEAVCLALTLVGAAVSLVLRRGSLVAREGPAR